MDAILPGNSPPGHPWVRVRSCLVCRGALAQETESQWGKLGLYCLNCGRSYQQNGQPYALAQQSDHYPERHAA